MPWLTSLSVGLALASAPGQPTNGDFEDGASGAEPPGWELSTGGHARLQVTEPAQGRQSVHLLAGTLSQDWSVDPLAGHHARLRLMLRADPDSVGLVQLVARSADDRLWRSQVHVRDPAWSEVLLDVELPTADALQPSLPLSLSLSVSLLEGDGLVIDAVSVEDRGALSPAEVAPLSAEAAARIAAFSRLYAWVRWFHPADETLTADWDAIALRGVSLAEQTTEPDQLARAWMALLQPVAPTVQVWGDTEPQAPAPLAGDRKVGWYQLGPAVSLATTEASDVSAVHGVGSTFRRFRIDSQKGGEWRSELHRTVSILELDAGDWQGDTVRLSVDAAVEGALDATVQLSVPSSGLSATTPSLRDGPTELLLRVPQGAERLAVSMRLTGPGAIELSRLELVPVRMSSVRRLAVAAGLTGLFSAVVGAIAMVGAIVTRRTVGGFIISLAMLGLLGQLAGLDPDIAFALPFVHFDNLEAIGFEDADQLAQVTELMGAPVRMGTSLGVFCTWVVVLLTLGAARLRWMDIRGGGD